jgi:spore coat protein U-like protein
MKSIIALLFLTLTVAPATSGAAAHSHTATLTVKGSVTLKCTLSTSPISFSMTEGYLHSPGNTVVQQSALGVDCTKGASAKVVMNSGLYGSKTSFGSWSMKSSPGKNYLGYNLCQNSSCATLWTQSYSYMSPSDKGSSLPVYAEIKTGQSQVDAGSYSDSVVVTVNL